MSYCMCYSVLTFLAPMLTFLNNIIQCQPKETEQLSPGAKMTSFWKDKILPKIANVYAYVSIPSMDR